MNEEEKRSHEKRRRATDGSVFGNSGSGARAEGLILMAEWEMGERREQKETERGREGGRMVLALHTGDQNCVTGGCVNALVSVRAHQRGMQYWENTILQPLAARFRTAGQKYVKDSFCLLPFSP